MAEYQTYPSTAHALGCGMNNGMPVIACICGLPNKGLAPMTTEPKPLDLPPMPEASSYFRPSARAVDWPNYCTDLEAWGRQLAEIAQAQARRADEAETGHLKTIDQRDAAEDALADAVALVTGTYPEWSNIYGYVDAMEDMTSALDTLKARVVEMEEQLVAVQINAHGMGQVDGLAQRDREVLALRDALEGFYYAIFKTYFPGASMMTDRERIQSIPARMVKEPMLAVHDLLRATAQAGADAEREVLEAAWGRLLATFPSDGVKDEIVWMVKAAILGTESGEGR